jgi:hypothetical protein
MPEPAGYEQYPTKIVIASNLLSLFTYLIGAYLMYQIGFFWAILYILCIIILELRLLGGHCTDCYYYGKTCAFLKREVELTHFLKREHQSNSIVKR